MNSIFVSTYISTLQPTEIDPHKSLPGRCRCGPPVKVPIDVFLQKLDVEHEAAQAACTGQQARGR